MRPPLIPQTISIHNNDAKQTKIFKTIYNALVEYREPKTNRIIVQLFMCLPSRKDFPEYFDIIQRPISMYEIRKRIESQYYSQDESCLNDFKLMFNNCRIFNEDGSQIFKDAVKLEEILMKKYDQLIVENGGSPAAAAGLRQFGSQGSDQRSIPTSTPTNRRADRQNSNSNHHPSRASSIKTENSTNYSSPSNNKTATTNNNHQHQDTTSATNHNHNNDQHHHLNGPSSLSQSTPNKAVINGLPNDKDNDNSNSNNFSSCNGNDDSLIISHNFHFETSIDSSSNLSMGANTSTTATTATTQPSTDKPKRLRKDPDAPKRRLLTGYIIYAAEVRKEYVDKHPNQDFGFISRLIGNDWRQLPRDLRTKYDQRALAHNKKIRERALRESMLGTGDGQAPSNGLRTPKLSKKKIAMLAKEQQNHLSTPSNHDNSSLQTTSRFQDHPSAMGSQPGTGSSYKSSDRNAYSPHRMQQTSVPTRGVPVETGTQTAPIRFVEPPNRRRDTYSENFRRYIESLDVPNRDLLAEETAPERAPEAAESCLGAGYGRHGSAQAALWALRDFMLQDVETMRWSMQPYLCYQNKN